MRGTRSNHEAGRGASSPVAPRGRRSGLLADESGNVLVLVALSMVALLSMLALAIDLGMLITARGEAQRAADSAALAGASAFQDLDPGQHLNDARAEADTRVADFASLNVIRDIAVDPASEVIRQWDETNLYRIRVIVHRQVEPLFFARIFGVHSWRVSAISAAEAARGGSTSCVKPFAIPDLWEDADDDDGNYVWDFDRDIGCNGNNCDKEIWDYDQDDGDYYDPEEHGYGTGFRDDSLDWQGNSYIEDEGRRIPIKINQGGDASVPSYWFPWVVPGNKPGASDYKETIIKCIPMNAEIGLEVERDSIETKNGNMPQPTWEAITDLIDGDTEDPEVVQ